MQEPFWLPVWQAAYAILSIATECALVLPFMLFLCLFLGRKRQHVAMSQTAAILHVLGLATAVLGAAAVAGSGLITLVVLPSSMPDLVPAPFEPFSSQWLATTTGFLSWMGGLLLFYISWLVAHPAYRTSFAAMDKDTASSMQAKSTAAALLALAATCVFASSIVLRNWPFLGLPAQLSQEDVLMVLLKHVWRTACAALMPAGGIAALLFFLQLEPLSARTKELDKQKRSEAIIPGTAEDICPLSDVQKTTIRMCTAFAIAGAAFQFLDASYTAFNSMAPMLGNGVRGMIMRFGPFVTTCLSLVCWGILFARPRRQHLLLALIPVLLLSVRAAARF